MHIFLSLFLAMTVHASRCQSPATDVAWPQRITHPTLKKVIESLDETPLRLERKSEARFEALIFRKNGRDGILSARPKRLDDSRMHRARSLDWPEAYGLEVSYSTEGGDKLAVVELDFDRSYEMPGRRTVRFSADFKIGNQLGELVGLVHQRLGDHGGGWSMSSRDIVLKWIPRSKITKDAKISTIDEIVLTSARERVVIPVKGSRRMGRRTGSTFERGLTHANGKEGVARVEFVPIAKGRRHQIFSMADYNLTLTYETEAGNQSAPIVLNFDHEVVMSWHKHVPFTRVVQYSAMVKAAGFTQRLFAHVEQSRDPHGWPASDEHYPNPEVLTPWYNQSVALTWSY